MPHPLQPPRRPANQLLRRLPPADLERLLALAQPVPLEARQLLAEVWSPVESVYWVNRGVASALTVTSEGDTIEVATIGNEGLVGLPALLGGSPSLHRVMVQVPGEALRVRAEALQAEVARSPALRRLILHYATAVVMQVSQAVACNGLHRIEQRCCRWLLECGDRIADGVVPLTHELLAMMLGVRRSSVTEVLRALQRRGLVRAARGRIVIVNRKGLEGRACDCYRVIREGYTRLLGKSEP